MFSLQVFKQHPRASHTQELPTWLPQWSFKWNTSRVLFSKEAVDLPLSVSCCLQTPPAKSASFGRTMCSSGWDRWRREISALIWVRPGLTGAALCKRRLGVAVNISVRTCVWFCSSSNPPCCIAPVVEVPRCMLYILQKDYAHMNGIWTNANTMAYIIQWLSYYKNRLLCNSIGRAAWRACVTLCCWQTPAQRGQTLTKSPIDWGRDQPLFPVRIWSQWFKCLQPLWQMHEGWTELRLCWWVGDVLSICQHTERWGYAEKQEKHARKSHTCVFMEAGLFIV